MRLAQGSRIGPYEVVGLLGAGGMGEVYRAHDSTLGRDVAVKLLPERFAGDSERLARFEREARILASLNHPNIAAIYGFVTAECGPAFVLELIDGVTLQGRLLGGALPLDDALRIAKQIANALEAAHERGVVHRDLKPANITIRRDGAVKVLDFGIAKLLGDSERVPADAATVTLTGAGVVIGTTPYMSPEQARGDDITRQTDIWAFGAILFEMLTGRRAFAGATTPDVLSAILRGGPEFDALAASTPPAVSKLVRRCLEREPKARLHDIADARLEIEDIERALSTNSPISSNAAAHRTSPRHAGWRPLAWVATLAAAALSAVGVVRLSQSGAVRHEVRLEMPPPAGMRFVSVPAISPDGRQIVFAAAPEAGGPGRLWLRPLAADTPKELQGTTDASYPFWSADGRFVGFFADGQLKRVPASGGNAVTLCPASAGRGGLWLDDDTIVFAATGFSPLVRIDAASGMPRPFTTLAEDETGHRFPQRLPDGQLLYFSVNKTPAKSGSRLVAIDDPKTEVAFLTTGGSAEYSHGHLIFNGAPQADSAYPVLAQRLTLPGGRLTGEPLEIGRARISETLGRVVMSTAPSGVIATLGRAEGIGQFTWMARDGRVLETVGEPASQLGVELSPDGQQLATYRARDIWTMNVGRPVPARVTGGGGYRHPIWSPDGSRLLAQFQGRGIGTFDLVTALLSTRDISTLREGTGVMKPSGWLRDGRLVWLEGGSAIWTKPSDGPAVVFQEDDAQTLEARVSPDGHWIAFATNRSGRFQIELRSFPEPGPRYPVSVAGGGYPRWRADGRELYYLAASGHLMAASFSPGAPPAIGTPAMLFAVSVIAHPDRGTFAEYEYDVSADGQRFLVNQMVAPPDTRLSIIVDWDPPR